MFFNFAARGHKFPSAAHTPQFEIHADAQDEKTVLTAGMILFHDQNIVKPDVHALHAPFLILS